MYQEENNLDDKELAILSLLEEYSEKNDDVGVNILLEKYLLYKNQNQESKESSNIEGYN